MIRNVTLEEISDGRLYGLNDMVKAGCDDCQGCFACCCGMGSSIVLDPYDMHRLTRGLGQTAAQLLADKLELNVVDGIVQPNIRMGGEYDGRCGFLNAGGRCSIHPYRPGICRLFPLGRYYDEDGSFQYFLQTHECRKEKRTKVKVRRWIDTPDAARYDAFVKDWHGFLKILQGKLTDKNAKSISMMVLQQFYLTPYGEEMEPEDGFYPGFYECLKQAKSLVEEGCV